LKIEHLFMLRKFLARLQRYYSAFLRAPWSLWFRHAHDHKDPQHLHSEDECTHKRRQIRPAV